MADKAIFLVSLNSTRLDALLEHPDLSDPLIMDTTEWDVFVFDIFEMLNGLFFKQNNIGSQSATIERLIEQVQTSALINPDHKQVIRLSEIEKLMQPYMCTVYNEYYGNPSFKRHCKSQIFQNLQPKLRDMGILNHKTPLLEIIAPFLLSEIAFYLYVFDNGHYDAIYGLESEMGIIKDIKAMKYPAFQRFLNHLVPHNRINVEIHA